jgi:AcrR family transcriptional regulator
MDEISAQLGVSKKTLYQYFSDKDELVEAVVRTTIRFAQEICDNNRDASKDAVHELFAAMDFVQEIFSEMNPAMMYDLQKFHVEIIARFRLEGMMLAFNQEVFPSTRYNLAELHKVLIEHFLFGVASLKGYKLITKYQQERININQ